MKRGLFVTVAVLASLPLRAQRQRRPDRGSVWKHLKQSYDKDGDGKITLAEYGRGGRAFKNLDRDGDEVITESDFSRRGRRRRQGATADRRKMLARTVGDLFGSFLNKDGKPGIDKAEWQRVIRSLGPEEDGSIPRGNLARLTGEAGKTRMAGMVRRRIVQTFDFDRSGDVTVTDLKDLFRELDADGDGNIEQGKEIVMPPGVGEMAPDFTLPFAKDAKRTVTLSSFRGKKPVALIFGSYT